MIPSRLIVPAVLVALVAAGCGSSATKSSTTAAASGTQRRAQLAACLKKQGIQPPERPRGATGPGGFFLFGGRRAGGTPPGDGSFRNSKFAAALQNCGVKPGQRRARFTGGRARLAGALNRFVACVRKNGYKLPKPNTSGNGPLFDPSKVNRNDTKLLAAVRRCQSTLPFGS